MNDQTTATAPVSGQRQPNPMFAPLNRLRDEIERVFDDFSLARPGRSIFAFPHLEPLPALELAETDDRYRFSVELPGLEEKDIDIEYAAGILTVSGEKREESEKKDGGFFMTERRYGAFSRTLSLPADADPEGIAATFERGVLKLDIRKKAAQATQGSRKIAIG